MVWNCFCAVQISAQIWNQFSGHLHVEGWQEQRRGSEWDLGEWQEELHSWLCLESRPFLSRCKTQSQVSGASLLACNTSDRRLLGYGSGSARLPVGTRGPAIKKMPLGTIHKTNLCLEPIHYFVNFTHFVYL